MTKNISIALILTYIISVNLSGQVTIGTDNPPHESAVLDLQSPNKGFLGPRVSLTGRFDNITVPNPVSGLLVLNTSDPIMTQPENERVYPYRLYYWVEEGATPRWERLIGQDELEYIINREIDNLSIPQPTMLYLNGTDILSSNRPGVLNFMRNITQGSSKDIPLMDSINHSNGAIRLKEGVPGTIILQPGIYNIVFAYLFIPTSTTGINCNTSSYFMDFPSYPKAGDPLRSIRVYSNTYHHTGSKSSHAATINFVSLIREETEWVVKLGAGASACTGVSGLSLPNRNTFFYITKIGNWNP